MHTKTSYDEHGYLTRISVLNTVELANALNAFSTLEAEIGQEACQTGILNQHFKEQFIWEMASHPRLLDSVKEVLGPNVVLLGTHFFCKYPDNQDKFVAWHQDVTYWGLKPPKAVSAWIAIDDTDVDNGCMRVIPGTHRGGILAHSKSDSVGNMLSINQEISSVVIDESKALDVTLDAGMMSLHDGMLVHGSNPNRSTRRRCGLTVRFTTTDVRLADEANHMGTWSPVLVCGEDQFSHLTLTPAPQFEV